MENNNQNRARYFGAYVGQPLVGESLLLRPLSSITDEEAVQVFKIASKVYNPIQQTYLNSYSHEVHVSARESDHITVKMGKSTELDIDFDADIQMFIIGLTDMEDMRSHLYSTFILEAYQYLQSVGIALPWMGLKVEEMVKYGWIKLK